MAVTTHRYSPQRRLRRPPLINVALPDTPGPHPSVVIVHGGGFVGGGRAMRAVTTVKRALTAAGYAAASFDYRLVFRGGRFGEAVEDALAAMAWWRAQADRFELDLERVSLLGLSAGAAIAMASAAEMTPLARLVGIYGPYDFLNLPTRARPIIGRVLLGTWNRSDWERRSPARSCDLPVPVALLHGVDDRLVSVDHTHALARYRQERGLPTTVHLYDDTGHGFLRHPKLPVTRQAVEDLLEFLGPR